MQSLPQKPILHIWVLGRFPVLAYWAALLCAYLAFFLNLQAGKQSQQMRAGSDTSMKYDLTLCVNSVVERFYVFHCSPSIVLSLVTSRYHCHWRCLTCAVTHQTACVSATMMLLLMNYKQTLRPSTFVPAASGLQPGDKWLPAQKTRTHIHIQSLHLSSIACLLTFLIYITTAPRQVTSIETLLPCFHLTCDSL